MTWVFICHLTVCICILFVSIIWIFVLFRSYRAYFQCNWTTGVIAPAWYWIADWNRTGFITFPLDVGSSCWQLKSTSTPPLFFSHRNVYKHLVFSAIRFDLFFIIFLVYCIFMIRGTVQQTSIFVFRFPLFCSRNWNWIRLFC